MVALEVNVVVKLLVTLDVCVLLLLVVAVVDGEVEGVDDTVLVKDVVNVVVKVVDRISVLRSAEVTTVPSGSTPVTPPAASSTDTTSAASPSDEKYTMARSDVVRRCRFCRRCDSHSNPTLTTTSAIPAGSAV